MINTEHLKGEIVYLATPYSHDDTLVREYRFLQCTKAAAWMINTLKINTFAPIVFGHPLLTRYPMPYEWDFWAVYDTAFISRCAEVWVLCVDGWDRSVGVKAEMDIAKKEGKRIRYIVPSADGYDVLDSYEKD